MRKKLKCDCCNKDYKVLNKDGLCYMCSTHIKECRTQDLDMKKDFWLSLGIYLTMVIGGTFFVFILPYLISDKTFSDFITEFVECGKITLFVVLIISVLVDLLLLYYKVCDKIEFRRKFRSDWGKAEQKENKISVDTSNTESVEFLIEDSVQNYMREDAKITEEFYEKYRDKESELKDYELENMASYLQDTPSITREELEEAENYFLEKIRQEDNKVVSDRKKVERPKKVKQKKQRAKKLYTRKLLRYAVYFLLLVCICYGTFKISSSIVDTLDDKTETTEVATTEEPYREYGSKEYGVLTLDSNLPVKEGYSESGALQLRWDNVEVVLDYTKQQGVLLEYIENAVEYEKNVLDYKDGNISEYTFNETQCYKVELSTDSQFIREYYIPCENDTLRILKVSVTYVVETSGDSEKANIDVDIDKTCEYLLDNYSITE